MDRNLDSVRHSEFSTFNNNNNNNCLKNNVLDEDIDVLGNKIFPLNGKKELKQAKRFNNWKMKNKLIGMSKGRTYLPSVT